MIDTQEIFPDNEPVLLKSKVLELVFKKDVFPTGLLNEKQIRGNVLDLGCGRGAVGSILKKKNPAIILSGVDIIHYDEPTLIPCLYSEFAQEDAVEFIELAERRGMKYDLVVSYGLPPNVVERIIRNGDIQKIVKPKGCVLLVFDIPINAEDLSTARKLGFTLSAGSYPSDPYILSWTNGG